jgi:hypothetical protein
MVYFPSDACFSELSCAKYVCSNTTLCYMMVKYGELKWMRRIAVSLGGGQITKGGFAKLAKRIL